MHADRRQNKFRFDAQFYLLNSTYLFDMHRNSGVGEVISLVPSHAIITVLAWPLINRLKIVYVHETCCHPSFGINQNISTQDKLVEISF